MGVEIDPMEVGNAPSLELDLPGGMRPSGSMSVPASRRVNAPSIRDPLSDRPPSDRSRLPIIGGAFGLVVLIGIVSIVAIPRIVSGRVRDAAAAGGVTITHDSPRVSANGVEMPNLSIAIATTPGASIKAKNAHVSFSGGEMVLKDVEATSNVPLDDFVKAFTGAEPALPKSFRAEGAHIRFSVAEDVALDSHDAIIADSADAVGLHTLSVTMPQTRLVTPMGEIGPFNVTFDRSPERAELKMLPVDGEPDGASAVFTWASDNVQVAIRAPHSRYHLPVKAMGLAGDDVLELDAKLDATIDATSAIKGNGSFSVFGVPIAGVPTDISTDFDVVGTTAQAAARTKRAVIGPFTGDIRAEWAKTDRKRARLTFHTDPIPCADIAKIKAAHGSPDAVLARFANYAGIAVVKGQANAAGSITITADFPPRLSTAVTRNDTCGVSFFQSRP
jgi:hypothetical protein